MTRPCRPWDLARWRGHGLGASPVDLETLILGGSPAREALVASLWPGSKDLVTLVQPDAAAPGRAGLVQARRRRRPTEADLTWLFPDLAAGNGTALLWGRLLAGICAVLGAGGVQRVFARVAADDAVALQVFRQAGFACYTEDRVYRRPPGARPAPLPGSRVVTAEADLAPAIAGMALRGRPDALGHAEPEGQWAVYPLGGHWPRGSRERAWLDARGAPLGAWRWVPGRAGSWLCLAAAAGTEPVAVLRHALADQGPGAGTPTFTCLRADEVDWAAALAAEQFEPVAHRARGVKHLAARVLAPGWRRRPLAEPAPDAAATRSAPWREAARDAPGDIPRRRSVS